MQFPASNFCTKAFPHLKIPKNAGAQRGDTMVSYKLHFYHAMHYSAKHGLAIAYRLSVRLSVCDVGGS